MQKNGMVKRLSQLKDMRHEVDELSQQLAKLELEAHGRILAPGPAARAAEAIDGVRARMEARRADCMDELGRLYAFIDGIPDSRLRRIFAFRYIDGLSWQQVAFRIGEHDEQYPRKLHNRYLKEEALGETSF